MRLYQRSEEFSEDQIPAATIFVPTEAKVVGQVEKFECLRRETCTATAELKSPWRLVR